ncbi:hypothetical protein SAMN02949497_4863 [Methylomagnum ishizawai]|uniref:Uncharacterized protein n=1 Tax=Methylomagnum ishizawai TaxID=1760988 RepID=A0A1Y6D612_9GAMM|nr:hypothetical protein [Methylomagnum ishizawai]SMF97880.1 hypothetical protein SAMN02949497_4863 [Methylomagnum ishizawai]
MKFLRNTFTLSSSVIEMITGHLQDEARHTHFGLYQRKSGNIFLTEDQKIDLVSGTPMADIRKRAFIFNHVQEFKAIDGTVFQAFVYQDAAQESESDFDLDDVIDRIMGKPGLSNLRNSGNVPFNGFVSELFARRQQFILDYVRSIREIKYIFMSFHDILDHRLAVEDVLPNGVGTVSVSLGTPLSLNVVDPKNPKACDKNILGGAHYRALRESKLRAPGSDKERNQLFFLPHIRTYNSLKTQVVTLFYSYLGRVVRIVLRRESLDRSEYSFDFAVTPRLVRKGALDAPDRFVDGKDALIFGSPMIVPESKIERSEIEDKALLNKLAFVYQSITLSYKDYALPYSTVIKMTGEDLAQVSGFKVSHAFDEESEAYDYFCAKMPSDVVVGNMFPLDPGSEKLESESVHQTTANKDYISALIYRTLQEKEAEYGMALGTCEGRIQPTGKAVFPAKASVDPRKMHAKTVSLGRKPKGIRHFFADDYALFNFNLREADLVAYWASQHGVRNLAELPKDARGRLMIRKGEGIAASGDHTALENLAYILYKCLSLSSGNIIQFCNRADDLLHGNDFVRKNVEAQLQRKLLCDLEDAPSKVIDYMATDFGIGGRSKAIFFDNRHADSARNAQHGVFIEVITIDEFARNGSVQMFDALHTDERGLMRELVNKDPRLKEEIRDLILEGDEQSYLFLIFDGNFHSWKHAKQIKEELLNCLGEMNADPESVAQKVIVAFIPKNMRVQIYYPDAGAASPSSKAKPNGLLVCDVSPTEAYVSFNAKRQDALQQKPYEVRLPEGGDVGGNLGKVINLLSLLHAKDLVLPTSFLEIRDHAIIHAIDKVTGNAALAEKWIVKENAPIIDAMVKMIADDGYSGEPLNADQKERRNGILRRFREDIDAHYADPSLNNLFITSVRNFSKAKRRNGMIKLSLFM